MKLIVGLGNPGNRYKNNRHNIGFMLLDKIAAENDWAFVKKKNFTYVKSREFILIKPRTYMNRSGIALTSALSCFKINDILTVSDDVNLPLGDLRLREKGGSGGHNGLKSITQCLGSDDYKRLRMGVDAPRRNDELADYVLANFSQTENVILKKVLHFAHQLLQIYLDRNYGEMLDYYSRNKITYSEELMHLQDQSPKEVH